MALAELATIYAHRQWALRLQPILSNHSRVRSIEEQALGLECPGADDMFLQMAKPRQIDLPDGTVIPILYEDRSVLAIDKPAGWLMAPSDWEETSRNLQRALESSINGGDFWARSRNLRYLRFVHRLDADTSGAVLAVKSAGALPAYSKLFEGRRVEKIYLTVVDGVPKEQQWTCKLAVGPDPSRRGRMRTTNASDAKPAETGFRVLRSANDSALVEARPITGRTHQIRVHLAAAGHAVLGDREYGFSANPKPRRDATMALRSISIAYRDPFTGRQVQITAPWQAFVAQNGFTIKRDELFGRAERPKT